MAEKLSVLTGMNLQQTIQQINQRGINRKDLVNIINMPNSGEFSVIYWKQYE